MKNLDKLYHFIAGFVIAIFISFYFANPLYGLLTGVTAGIAKEVYDYYDYGHGDFWDFFATLAGTFAGVFLFGFLDIFISIGV